MWELHLIPGWLVGFQYSCSVFQHSSLPSLSVPDHEKGLVLWVGSEAFSVGQG